jgi:hypothetical protein
VACHGTGWAFANLDAPGLAELLEQEHPSPPPEEEPAVATVSEGGSTFDDRIGPLFAERCTTCHSSSIATGGLVLETYNLAMVGTSDGPVINPGDAEGSLLVQTQREGHFATFTEAELQMVIDWINSGAPED